MNHLLVISFALIFPLVGVLPASEQTSRRQRNRSPSIESFISSSTAVLICPFVKAINRPEVDLFVNATDPDGDSLVYEYSAAEGSISGKGKLVVWNLDRLPYGPHEVRVTVTDGKGGKAEAVLKVITMVHTSCDKPPPACPVVRIGNP